VGFFAFATLVTGLWTVIRRLFALDATAPTQQQGPKLDHLFTGKPGETSGLLKQRLHRYLHLAESDLVLSLSSIPVTAV
jgi:hypothetical protein